MKKFWVIGLAVVMVLAVAIIAGCTTTEIQEPPVQTGISVGGQGSVKVQPDLAILSLGVEAQAETVAEARDQAAEGMNGVMAALKNNGVAEKDIQTSRLNIFPVTRWNEKEGKEERLGFRVTNTVVAKIRALDKVGPIIDAAVAAGGDVTRVQGISFSVEDPKPSQQQAREKAIADAQAKAEQMARLTGVKLGKPLSISESGGFFPPVPVAFAERAGVPTAAPTPVSPGEQEVSVNVQILYEID